MSPSRGMAWLAKRSHTSSTRFGGELHTIHLPGLHLQVYRVSQIVYLPLVHSNMQLQVDPHAVCSLQDFCVTHTAPLAPALLFSLSSFAVCVLRVRMLNCSLFKSIVRTYFHLARTKICVAHQIPIFSGTAVSCEYGLDCLVYVAILCSNYCCM